MKSKFPLWMTAKYSKIAMSSEVKLEVFVPDLSFDKEGNIIQQQFTPVTLQISKIDYRDLISQTLQIIYRTHKHYVRLPIVSKLRFLPISFHHCSIL